MPDDDKNFRGSLVMITLRATGASQELGGNKM